MRPDKHKKKSYFQSSRYDYDPLPKKAPKNISEDDDKIIDKLPTKEPFNPSYRGKYPRNSFERFLRKNIDKQWDDVYSRLVQKTGCSLEDVKYRVSLHTYYDDEGRLIEGSGFLGHREIGSVYGFHGFYVSPEGILKEQPRIRYTKIPEKKLSFIEDWVVFKDNGLYFKAPKSEAYSPSPYSPDSYWSRSYGHKDRYGLSYRDCINGKLQHQYIPSKHIRQVCAKDVKRWEKDLPTTEINN